MRYISFFFVILVFLFCSSIGMGEEGSKIGTGESQEVRLDEDLSDEEFSEDEEEDVREISIGENILRVVVETSIGGVASFSMVIPALLPSQFKNKVVRGIMVPVSFLAASAIIGAGVHLGSYLMDGMSDSWVPYTWAMANGVFSSLLLFSVSYKPEGSGILGGLLFMGSGFVTLIMSVVGTELSHNSNYKEYRRKYVVLPSISLDKDYKSFGLRVVF